MRRALASPALHFLALGALLLAAQRVLFPEDRTGRAERERIEITRARVVALGADWTARTGEAPDVATLRALVAAEVDDEILLREARARGLEVGDPVVRARLARNLGFLRGEDERHARAGDARRVDEALALGLARSDLLVRRRLVERMRAELSARVSARPSAAEVEARFARESADTRGVERLRLSHVFLSRDRRGVALRADAQRLHAEIASGVVTFERAIADGDAFLLGHVLPARTSDELEREFGTAFARAAVALEPGRVSQPIASSYGLHLVWVHERRDGPVATLESERARIEAELAREREAAALELALAALRARYEIRVAGASS